MELSTCRYCQNKFQEGLGFLEDDCAQYCSASCWLLEQIRFSNQRLERLEKGSPGFIKEWMGNHSSEAKLLLILEPTTEKLEHRLHLLTSIEKVNVLEVARFYKEHQWNPNLIDYDKYYRLDTCKECYEQINVQYVEEKNALVYGACQCRSIASIFNEAYVIYKEC